MREKEKEMGSAWEGEDRGGIIDVPPGQNASQFAAKIKERERVESVASFGGKRWPQLSGGAQERERGYGVCRTLE